MKQTTIYLLALFLSTLFFGCSGEADNFDIESTIAQMSLQEKVEFIGGYESFNIRPFPQYGIPEIHMADGPVGVRNYGASTAYPASITLAAAWDKNLANETGAAIGMEARNKNVHIMLGPGMNIHRGPLCGRNFEYLGEDPYLAGQIASAYVVGVQNQGVVATAKHYVANYQDYDRHNVSSDMDMRTLHEIYLPAFKTCVQEGEVGAVMTAYNLINGVHASEHDYLINQVLKTDWGFEGIVMSDWTSTYNGVNCAKAGLDLEMPAGTYMNPDTLIPAIESGELTEEVINEKVRRILSLYKRFGYFENPDISEGFMLDSAMVRETALQAARGGITLLKNEEKVLPITADKKIKVAVIGVNADPAVTGGGGSSYTQSLYPVSLLKAIKKVGGDNVEVVYAKALYIEAELPPEYYTQNEFYTYQNGKKVKGVSAEFFGNTELEGDPVLSKLYDKLNFSLADSSIPELPEVNYSARFNTVITPEQTGDYRMVVAGDDGYRLYLNDKLIIEYWQNQAETARSKSVKLEAGKEYKVKLEYYQAGGDASIRFAWSPELDKQSQVKKLWADAVGAAKTADVVVFSAGFNRNTETEGSDRTWELPYGQDEMISKLAAYNSNSIVVLNAGGNVAMPWLNQVKGLIHAWYPGQEGNIAAAEILFGKINPSGKLPVSFEADQEDNPTFTTYHDPDGDKHVYFDEGVFLGYRFYDQSETKPRFPFGYGLSYTTFDYSDVSLSASRINKTESVQVSFTIKNTGDREGAEIAQLYVHDSESELPRPLKELKGFEKIQLKAGEEKSVTISLSPEAFSYYNEAKGGWITEPGDFEILVGSSSEDIRLKTKLTINE